MTRSHNLTTVACLVSLARIFSHCFFIDLPSITATKLSPVAADRSEAINSTRL